MNILIKKQQGSFFAEVGAVIASISILTIISSSYMDSMAGRAQVTEGFVLAQPIIQNVNDYYASYGLIKYDETASDAGNYDGIDVYDNSATGNVPNDFAGRYVQDVQSFANGVVQVKFNDFANDSNQTHHMVGQVSNTQTAIAGKYIYFIPFLIGETEAGLASENTSLRWGCATTIDANPPTGSVIAPLVIAQAESSVGANDAVTGVSNEQYFYAPGCLVISNDQANCLNPLPGSKVTDASSACANGYLGPENWNLGIPAAVDNVAP